MVKFSRIALLLFADIICINFAYILSFLIRFNFDVNSTIFSVYFAVYANNLLTITAVRSPFYGFSDFIAVFGNMPAPKN